MKGFQLSSGWLQCLFVGLLTQQIATVSSVVYTMNQTCAHISGGFIGHPSSCELYGYCANKQLQGVSSCPSGYIFNSEKGVCNDPSFGGCTVANPSNICKYEADKTFKRDPNNCQRYCYCENKVARWAECPMYQIFDESTAACIWGSQSKCSEGSICRLCPNGVFAGIPDRCGNQYYACNKGVGTLGTCPKNTYFNENEGVCQTSNPCGGNVVIGVGPGVLQPLPNNPTICQSAKGTTFPQYLPDGQTCMGYFVCNSAKTDVGVWTKCPMGLHFNNGKCVTPYTFSCTYDRCANIGQTFVSAIGASCQNYLICKNQTSQADSSGYSNFKGLPCPNKQYFNEFTGMCQPTSPKSKDYQLCV